MFRTPTNLKFSEPSCKDFPPMPPSVTDLLSPPGNYLVRSNLPGLCFEIEKPDEKFQRVDLEAGKA